MLDDQVALFVPGQPLLEGRGVRPVADRKEEAFDGEVARCAGCHVAQAHAGDGLLAEHLVHGHAAVNLDCRMALGAGLHDLAGPELVPAVEEVDLRGEACQVEGLLEGRVAAPDHGDLLVPEEEAVAGRAGRHAVPAEPLLGREAQPDRRRPGCHDDGLGAVLHAARPDPERAAGEVDAVGLDVEDARPEALCLLAEAEHQLGTLDPVGEARVVLDVGRDRELAAGLVAGQDDRREVRPGRVDGGRQAGRAGAQDQDVRLVGALCAGGRRGERGSEGGRIAGAAEVDREAAEGGGGVGHREGRSRAGVGRGHARNGTLS